VLVNDKWLDAECSIVGARLGEAPSDAARKAETMKYWVHEAMRRVHAMERRTRRPVRGKLSSAMQSAAGAPPITEARRRYLTSDERLEIHRGVVRAAPSPTPCHNRWARRIVNRLDPDERADGAAGWVFVTANDIDLCIEPEEVRQPDIAGYRLHRWQPAWDDMSPIPAPPNWACEIWSSGNSLAHREELLEAYFLASAVESVWTIDRKTLTLKVFTRGTKRWRTVLVVDDLATTFRAPPFETIELSLGELLR
jgi:Uma2 family endonuclease